MPTIPIEILLNYLQVASPDSLLSEEGGTERDLLGIYGKGSGECESTECRWEPLRSGGKKSKADTKMGKIWNHRREDSNLYNGLSCSESVFFSGIP